MKLIDNGKSKYDEVVKVELTLKELIVMYGSLSSTNSIEVGEFIADIDGLNEIGKEIKENDLTYQGYKDVGNILEYKGIDIE